MRSSKWFSMRSSNACWPLKTALAVLDRERSALKFHRSKLILLGVNDYAFTASIKQACPDKAAAETFIRQLMANPNAVLKLNGAQALKMRLMQSIEADATTLRHVAERIVTSTEKPVRHKQHRAPAPYDPYRNEGTCMGVIFITGALGIISGLAGFASLFDSLADSLANYSKEYLWCALHAEARLQQCQSAASTLEGSIRDKERARCSADYVTQLVECLRGPSITRAFPWGDLPKFLGSA